MINQTPWSSFITIRRKFIDSACESVTGRFDDTNTKNQGELATVEEKNRQLEKKIKALE